MSERNAAQGLGEELLALVTLMKPLALAKQRLRPALDELQRRRLARSMLLHVLDAILNAEITPLRAVLSADPLVLELARERGFIPLSEQHSGYNKAARQAVCWAMTQRASSLLLLPADLPDLSPDDLRELLHFGRGEARVAVVAPDAAENGTNALLLRPPDLFEPSFGRNSFNRHLALARLAGVEPRIFRSPGFARDIDLPIHLNENPKIAT
ncbi:MAG: 2-phospho-L-lactate guanylyltransferase [Chloroflexi bacterium]|nr:2-phospho-L-lactate guanylyltransferase [Chloroflexota bacterium]